MNKPAAGVDDYMARDLISFRPEDDIHYAIRILVDNRISGAPVVDANGKLVGVLSKKDCLQVIYSTSYHQDWGGRVQDYLSADVHTIESGTDVIAAAELFIKSSFRRFPIMSSGRLVGQISRHDILRALSDLW
jgi:CBS domain-containing protein